MRWLDSIIHLMDLNLGKLGDSGGQSTSVLQSMESQSRTQPPNSNNKR